MHRLLGQDGLAVQSAVALGLSALAPAGWPQLTPWQASFIARLGSRFLAAWVNGEAVKVQPEEGRDLAHLLEVLSLLARTQWAQIADCPRDIARHAITPEEARKLGIELPKVPRGIWHRTRL